ncbi:hypothetical protein BG910_05925 [Neisseria chenwenguii]|uniref:Uncharacterized protein n=1 Tax=Neisseria chenwenguii TaxID=1853278 RepID=A0A220S1L9_9NEIS|nr:hypothetical protein BG910_05925 [Neisseria chenwenguii]
MPTPRGRALRCARGDAQQDFAVFGGIARGVAEQVAQHELQKFVVAGKRQGVVGEFAFEADAFFEGGKVGVLQNLAAEGGPIDGLCVGNAVFGVEFGEGEELVDEVFGALDDLAEMVGLFVRFADGEDFGLDFEGGKR